MREAAAHAFVVDLDAPELSDDDRRHLERVLRLRPGQDVTVSDGAGRWRRCRFGDPLEPAGGVVEDERLSPPVAVALSLTKGERLDWAVQKLTEHMDGPLIEEFELALGGIRIGEGRSEALKKMADRSSSQEMASFVRAIIQADQLGISLGRILKVQAGDTRLKRQLLAEEKAMKAPIKMLFPTVIFIFPAMFLVILGPAFINLMHYLK